MFPRLFLFTLLLNLFASSFALAAFPAHVQGLDLLKGQKIEASAAEGRPLVVVFVSAKCPCSDSHLSELKTLAKEFSQVSWLAVHSNSDESKELSQAYFKKASLPFPILQDSSGEWADQFKALKTPHAFIVNAKGEILYQGGVSNSHQFEKADRRFLHEALQDITKGQDVRTKTGRTLGCVISRGEKNVW